MNNPINKEVFDSRDLVEYMVELRQDIIEIWNELGEEFGWKYVDDFEDIDLDNETLDDRAPGTVEEYKQIKQFVDDIEEVNRDIDYGVTLIHDDVFIDQCKQEVEGCGYISKNTPSWVTDHIDWDGIANEMRADYGEVWYDHNKYYLLKN